MVKSVTLEFDFFRTYTKRWAWKHIFNLTIKEVETGRSLKLTVTHRSLLSLQIPARDSDSKTRWRETKKKKKKKNHNIPGCP